MISRGSINTDVGLHSECLPQISRPPSLKYQVAPSSYHHIVRSIHASRLTGYTAIYTFQLYTS